MGRPRKPDSEKYRTPAVSFRPPPDLDAEIRAIAEAEGVTYTAVLVRAMRREVRAHRRHTPKESRKRPPDTSE